MKTGIELIAEEREKQINKWSNIHDRQYHSYGELAVVAACLAVYGTDAKIKDNMSFIDNGEDVWGLTQKYKEDRVKQLQVAGALIAAEIDRLNAN